MVSAFGSTATPCQVGSRVNSADLRSTGTPCPFRRCVPTSSVAPVSGSTKLITVPTSAARRTRRSSTTAAWIGRSVGSSGTAVMRQASRVRDGDSAIVGSRGRRITVAVCSVCTDAAPNIGSSRSGEMSMRDRLIEHDQRRSATTEYRDAELRATRHHKSGLEAGGGLGCCVIHGSRRCRLSGRSWRCVRWRRRQLGPVRVAGWSPPISSGRAEHQAVAPAALRRAVAGRLEPLARPAV